MSKGVLQQRREMVLMGRPHKKCVKKIVGRALRNEIDVTEVCKYSYSVSPTTV